MMAVAANLSFAARSLFTKQLQHASKLSGAMAQNQSSMFLNQHLIGLILVVPGALLRQETGVLFQVVLQRDSSLFWLLLNGLSYFMYNQLSLVVLSQTTAVTHGLGNAMRRIANILFALMIFGNLPKAINAFGMLLAIGGAICYTKVKSAPANKAPQKD